MWLLGLALRMRRESSVQQCGIVSETAGLHGVKYFVRWFTRSSRRQQMFILTSARVILSAADGYRSMWEKMQVSN